MEFDAQLNYLNLEQLTTEELEKLLVKNFVVTGETVADADYIMTIMGVINERKKNIVRQTELDVNAAWKEFQEEYQGQASAFARDDK